MKRTKMPCSIIKGRRCPGVFWRGGWWVCQIPCLYCQKEPYTYDVHTNYPNSADVHYANPWQVTKPENSNDFCGRHTCPTPSPPAIFATGRRRRARVAQSLLCCKMLAIKRSCTANEKVLLNEWFPPFPSSSSRSLLASVHKENSASQPYRIC